MTTKELNALVREFKELVEMDVVGITASDARRTVASWLYAIGQDEQAETFENKVLAYQESPKIQKMIQEGDNDL